MESLRSNLHLLHSLKILVESKNTNYYSHKIINEKEITENTISIVMTSHERSQQVYFTLSTIKKCNYNDIQVIIVDDSSSDPILEDKLKEFDFHIELISIDINKKYWANPCINYNIGFQYIKGSKVVIQNGEVCYVGDILNYVKNIDDNCYYVFDVKASRDFTTNNIIYNKENLDISMYDETIYVQWYQHHRHRNNKFHFLTAITKNTFNKIKGFSYDYSFGSSYDDDDFVLKIKMNDILFVNVKNEYEKIGGIHLFHGYNNNHNINKNQHNENLCKKKQKYTEKNKSYLELSDINDYNKLLESYNLLNTY